MITSKCGLRNGGAQCCVYSAYMCTFTIYGNGGASYLISCPTYNLSIQLASWGKSFPPRPQQCGTAMIAWMSAVKVRGFRKGVYCRMLYLWVEIYSAPSSAFVVELSKQ